jgi:hypothetical protein
MLFKHKIQTPTAAYPRLCRVWIKTGNARMPLKSLWIDESKLDGSAGETGASTAETENSEYADDNLRLAA